MRDTAAKASFTLRNVPREGMVKVIGETRSIPVHDGKLEDNFKPNEVHLYQFK